MLETVRQYAGNRLAESGETPDVRLRHADLFLVLAEATSLGLKEAKDPVEDAMVEIKPA